MKEGAGNLLLSAAQRQTDRQRDGQTDGEIERGREGEDADVKIIEVKRRRAERAACVPRHIRWSCC